LASLLLFTSLTTVIDSSYVIRETKLIRNKTDRSYYVSYKMKRIHFFSFKNVTLGN